MIDFVTTLPSVYQQLISQYTAIFQLNYLAHIQTLWQFHPPALRNPIDTRSTHTFD